MGDNSLNSYAEEEKNSVQLSNTVNIKGLLRYIIDFGNYKNDFMINTILRNSGIKDEDGESLKADNIKDANTQENAIIITGAENFFKKEGEDGASNLTRFSLKAEKTLTEIVKEFDEACTMHKDVFVGKGKPYESQALKEEANKMVYFAELCLGVLNNKIDIEKENSDLITEDNKQRIKNYIQFAKILNDAVECENNVATCEQSYKINTETLAEYNPNFTIDADDEILACLSCSMWASAFAICGIIDICIDQSELIKKIKDTDYYENILNAVQAQYEQKNFSYVAGSGTVEIDGRTYTKEEIAIVAVANINRNLSISKNTMTILDSNGIIIKPDKSNLFGWVYWANDFLLFPQRVYNGNVNNRSQIVYFPIGTPSEDNYDNYYFLLTEQAEAIDKDFAIKGDIELNKTPTTTEHSVQKENTYKILQTEDQKIYWDENKLILEVPIDLPEEMKITILNDVEHYVKMTDFQLCLDYLNSNYLVVPTPSDK